jgi:hypothetical protein
MIMMMIIIIIRGRRRINVRSILPYTSTTLSILVDILDSCSVFSNYYLFRVLFSRA